MNQRRSFDGSGPTTIGHAAITGRYFLVGCVRSGTTLLQAMLARHSQVFSFPESHFFCKLGARRRIYRKLGIANRRKARAALSNVLELVEREDLEKEIPRYSPSYRSYTGAFHCVLDKVAADQGKDIWLEKTPHHLDHIGAIQLAVPGARFIHILRDGRDVVASMHDARLKDDVYWRNWSYRRMARTWNGAVQTSLNYRTDPGHILVSYEGLLNDAAGELERLCGFMGIEFEPEMLRHWEAAEAVVGWLETYKMMENAFKPLQDTRLEKFSRLFSQERQQFIRQALMWEGKVGPLINDGMLWQKSKPTGVIEPQTSKQSVIGV